MRWLPLVVAAVLLLCLAGGFLLSRHSGPHQPQPRFPAELVPAGASVVNVADGVQDLCYLHRIATVRDVSPRELGTWAAALNLPCVADAGECSGWSTDARTDPFWERDLCDVEGLDTVTATVSGGVLTIDWGDYLCSGPN